MLLIMVITLTGHSWKLEQHIMGLKWVKYVAYPYYSRLLEQCNDIDYLLIFIIETGSSLYVCMSLFFVSVYGFLT